jgi:hypothetical protein
VLHKNVFNIFISKKHLSGSAVVTGVVSMIFSRQYPSEREFWSHCLLLFDGDLKPRILEILPSHKDRVQSAVFLYSAWGKLTRFHKVPSKEILGCIEEIVQTPTTLLQKGDR